MYLMVKFHASVEDWMVWNWMHWISNSVTSLTIQIVCKSTVMANPSGFSTVQVLERSSLLVVYYVLRTWIKTSIVLENIDYSWMIEICLRVILVMSNMNTCHKNCISYSSFEFFRKIEYFQSGNRKCFTVLSNGSSMRL